MALSKKDGRRRGGEPFFWAAKYGHLFHIMAGFNYSARPRHCRKGGSLLILR